MIILDGRGKNMLEIKKKNRERVKKWFEDNPGSTITECCKKLNMVYGTVRSHIDALYEDEHSNEDTKGI